MKKNIINIVMLFAMFVSINVFGQAASKVVLVQTTSLAQGGKLNNLSYGKLQGFSQDNKAFVVVPNDDNATTLANLENELKAIAPTTTVDAFKLPAAKERKVVPAPVNTVTPTTNQSAPVKVTAPSEKRNTPANNGYNPPKGADKATFKRNVVSTTGNVAPAKAVETTPAKVVAPVERRNVPAVKGSDKPLTPQEKRNLLNNK
jgi:hypothetical protein